MADRNKFEEMLERLVNEDRAGAEELFHEIVVEKSRDIYESLLETDLEEEADEDQLRSWYEKYNKYDSADVEKLADGMFKFFQDSGVDLDTVEKSEYDALVEKHGEDKIQGNALRFLSDEDTPVTKAMFDEFERMMGEADEESAEQAVSMLGLDEGFDLDEFEVEADDNMDGDPADDMMGDIEADMDDDDDNKDMDMGDEDDEEMEDRIVDLEDALDDLKAEFEKMMADDNDADDMGTDAEDGMDDEDDEAEKEEFAFEAEDEEVEEGMKKKKKKSYSEEMREYVELVGGHGAEKKGSAETADNKKSTIDNMKNDMGGTASNLNQGDTGETVEAGKGAIKGSSLSDASAKDMNTGNVNTPGSKTATKMSGTKGHGAEKKGAGETADNTKSNLG